jgi:HK97 family phage major capsid protein
MPYDSVIDRTGSAALIPEDVSREIIQGVPEASAVMQLARRLPNMSRKQRRMPVLESLITAYFVSGDTGLKQTAEVAWGNKYINAEELAVIVPIPEAVLDDADYDIWGEIRPRIVEALGVAFDAAVLFGTNAPADWPDDIRTAAAAASHTIDLSTQIAAGDDIYDVIMGESGLLALVEADGFMPSGHVAAMTMRAKLRGLRDSNGVPIFNRSMQDDTRYELDGEPIIFPRNGAINPATALMFTGDWNQLVYAMRQDITYKMLDQAVIQDGAGNILYNLAQQDMVALRAVMRLGWQVPNPINRMNSTEATRYPFSVLVP